eukprot:CAMPEP_0171240446 /NCGR_PEP_ID=MMETSP0790-20130122/44513_1 /TAXON_ID=2925 /ORGANISM="Alexandrium catenella, Strain OF101" /LENGTH=320 /DNA_ID=CAMNT_0011706883 /DNA_START=18 /DNA_END=981 /DNA_ORIENTATION=-
MYPTSIDTGMRQLNFELKGNRRQKNRTLCMQHPELYNYTIDVFHDSAFHDPYAGGWGDAPDVPEDGNPVPTDLQYADKPWPDVEKDHAAVITYLDGKVGDLLQRLKSLGVDNNTLVFFASDNGAHLEGGHSHLFFDSTGGLPGHKRSMYEGGIRSPTMARWPAVIKPGRKSNFAWAFWDMLPTVAELAGAPTPPGLDGISIAPELRGEAQPAHEYLFFTWVDDGGRTNQVGAPRKPPGYTVRMGRWKGMVPHCGDGENLQPSMADEMRVFDLESDPLETADVAANRTDVAAAMKELVISKNLSCMCFQCGWEPPVEQWII